MVFHKRLSDRESPLVFRTPFCILADLDDLHLSNFSSPFYQYFEDCSECTNYNWYHRHLNVPLFLLSFFLGSLARSKYLSLFSLSLIITLWFTRSAKSIIRQALFFSFLFFFNFIYLFCYLSLSLFVWLGLGDLFVS